MKNNSELATISVGLRLDGDEMRYFYDRQLRVSEILTRDGGTFTMTAIHKEKYTEIEYLATVPREQANKHHGFDSMLNETWPEGAGAAWVEEMISHSPSS